MNEAKKITYHAVVESGSCDPSYARWEEARSCGHKHKTVTAAETCLAKKQRYYCQHGRPAGSLCKWCLGYAQAQNTSAGWYRGTIHDTEGYRIGDRPEDRERARKWAEEQDQQNV